MYVYVCMFVCVRERNNKGVCVFYRKRKRECMRERVRVHVCVRIVCACVREGKRERILHDS